MSIETYQLDNGLRILFHPIPYAHTVSINVRVDAGSRHDGVMHGIAHFVEHMLFQGTVSRPSNYALTAYIEALGGEIWGATHSDYGSYWLNIPHRHLIQVLPIFLEFLRAPLFDANSLAREKSVIGSEIQENLEDGWGKANQLLDHLLWPNDPRGFPTIGNAEVVAAITQRDVQDFYHRYYHPQRIVCVIAGNVNTDDVIQIIRSAWDDWNSGLSIQKQPIIPPIQMHQQSLYQEWNEGITHLLFGIKTPPLHHRDYEAATILATLVGGGMSSRLYTALRGEEGLCYTAQVDMDELVDTCILRTYVATMDTQFGEVIQRIHNIFVDLREGNISDDEFQLHRGQTVGKVLMAMDTVPAYARNLAISTFLTGTSIPIGKRLEYLEHITVDDVRRLATQIFQPDKLHFTCVGKLTPSAWNSCEGLFRT